MSVAVSKPVEALKKIAILREEVAKVIVGQEELIERLILALLCKSHVLIEGIPGLAKTLTVNTLSRALGAGIQPYTVHP